jgi:hypothetical protein
MDQSEFDIGSADLPHRARRSQALVRVIDGALADPLVRKARAAIARLGTERQRQSYFTTFWLPRGAPASHPVEEAVLDLWRLARVRGCASGTDADHAGGELLGAASERSAHVERERHLSLAPPARGAILSRCSSSASPSRP